MEKNTTHTEKTWDLKTKIEPTIKMKDIIALVLFLITSSALADDCVFDETSYRNFITEYAASHPKTKLTDDKSGLSIQHDHETILITGGGCDHLGGSIVATGNAVFNQEELLAKVGSLSAEYASWLIDTKQLQSAIKNKSWTLEDGFYRINLDEMTVFEAFQDEDGKIEISFYIN